MYLKSLEIQGFKSFPEKTRLTFDKPVSAVVGPNGSGKSNIADAILWVMGEQSTKTLRGGKMEDVIFGGTARRPQLGFAEVSLEIDNSERIFDLDYPEIVLTRRYYRSGESEYFINHKLVRLRDVNELLMDTGLGREGYSVIGQGRIDAILSQRSTDRREIFEEAAGISRFRYRKEDAERKLAQTEDNLLRINDKISELALQVEPLREQAEVAKRYLILRDELRELEISLWLDTIEKLGQQAQKIREDSAATAAQKQKAAGELENWYRETESFSEQMRGLDRALEENREEIRQCETRRSEAESAIAVLRTRLENTLSETERVKRELSEQEGRDGGLKAQIDEREARLLEIEREKEILNEKTKALLESLEALAESAGAASQRLARLMGEETALMDQLGQARERLSALASSLQEMYDRENAVESEILTATERHSAAVKAHEACLAALKEAQEQHASLKNAVSGYTMRLESRKKKVQEGTEKKSKAEMALNALRARRRMLEEMEKEYQGYSKAVKSVMHEAGRGVLKNIHGTVAGLVKTKDRYTVAIETALGGAMQHIIVSSEEDGKAAIAFLKRRDGGRATFLPMSSIRGRVLERRGLENAPGCVGLALDLVEFDPKYTEIYKNLLGRTAITETLDDAIALARRHGNTFKIVTLDGQVINAGGSMTGGSATSHTGILSRANELEGLAEQEEKLAGELSRAEAALNEALREMKAAEYEVETAMQEVRAVEDRLIKLETDRDHGKLLVDAAQEAISALRAELSTLSGRIEANDKETAALRVETARLEEGLTAVRAKIQKDSEGQDMLKAERDALNNTLSERRAQVSSLDAEAEAVRKAVSELSALRNVLTGGRRQQEEYLEELSARHTGIIKEIAEQEAACARLLEQQEALRQRSESITAEKLNLEAQREKRARETQEKNQELLQLERECSRLEQKLLAAELEEKQLIDKLWDTYELSRTAAKQIARPAENLTEMRQRIAELKKEISALGTPNIGAIDEFERVNERYTYLTDQRDDVEKAKTDLLAIIRDITQEMKALFAREFESIRESFRETFLEFFGGGQASLELEDPEDILSCGIEIKVQPPGKSLKTIMLLSGGEKALVAIALYFAILKVRPTPFVVLDEIDAALDEANVLRFAENMRKMAVRTQMIVITHHRGTMEEADVIFGVTMQEQGVSRVLSIDLEEAERALGRKEGTA
jgi:chromosome segregation protein